MSRSLPRLPLRADGLEQELDDFDVPHGLRQRLAPSVHSVAAKKECMARRMLDERLPHLAGKPLHVLVVFEDRNPLAVLVRRDAVETLQHLVAFDGETARRRVTVGEQRAPHRMRVQHGARARELARSRRGAVLPPRAAGPAV